jgi:hypothetical protein
MQAKKVPQTASPIPSTYGEDTRTIELCHYKALSQRKMHWNILVLVVAVHYHVVLAVSRLTARSKV